MGEHQREGGHQGWPVGNAGDESDERSVEQHGGGRRDGEGNDPDQDDHQCEEVVTKTVCTVRRLGNGDCAAGNSVWASREPPAMRIHPSATPAANSTAAVGK